ncbi:hypothetical protein [Sodalis sp. RH19]|uniref:hypothetical protein n=1 Tax=Sodalis sp. RH19 TaxID=3394334 RepID=UPI0039B5255F
MNTFEFSIKSESISFLRQGGDRAIKIPAGYVHAAKHLFKSGMLTAYDLEMLIYRIEEMIESDKDLFPVNGGALCQDELMKEVSSIYLDGSNVILPSEIEAAFNTLADRLSYSAIAIPPEKVPSLTYFVFIREMTHHFHIDKITIL